MHEHASGLSRLEKSHPKSCPCHMADGQADGRHADRQLHLERPQLLVVIRSLGQVAPVLPAAGHIVPGRGRLHLASIKSGLKNRFVCTLPLCPSLWKCRCLQETCQAGNRIILGYHMGSTWALRMLPRK